MHYDVALQPGVLERRYKRFLADVALDNGQRITAHCPNTGSMLGCAEPGQRVWLSRSDNPRRKYAHTWEQVAMASGVRVGIHTGRTNALVFEAIAAGELIPEADGSGGIQTEVNVPNAPMRADFWLPASGAYVEVKNVTAAVSDGVAVFPDAPSERGVRHLDVLEQLVQSGTPGVLVFCAQRADVEAIRPADDIDPTYGRTLRRVMDAGVEVIGLGARVHERGIEVDRRVPVVT
ncbi:UNVERIFIED_CONTAM: DNA/RNA nuclease SfsA [Spiribacter pallidus]|jgi:sugar fermentation stimulation protein A|uniref:DNA/RNA nuclease SfsA n=1 Tax=Spiribacter pallidus TaxID=1987936 RepID=UPI00349F7740